MKNENELLHELALFIFNTRKFQNALDTHSLKLTEKNLTNYFKGWSQSGGSLTKPLKEKTYIILGSYETNSKGVTITEDVKIENEEGQYTTSHKTFFKWELIASKMHELSPYLHKQLSFFD